ncbi:hypothetical protein [Pseudoalteromonas piratica]|jgi:hypothetical protein|uniref:Uncharacterized protein n=1 Tax=Pseudoalteromonas piratica TaxID=1348114 RepID=A0A0A7ECV2_9GAMM|nr:hypothetical protein [Pseudoalteromonas piratica]AIY63916.1 hypothetical protein OM33_01145 [Pseudoalteromonas piratica]
MSAVSPVTAGSEIAVSTTSNLNPNSNNADPDIGLTGFSQDVVNISKLAREKQLQSQLSTEQEIKQIQTDVIRVTSTIGQSKAAGNLSESQADKLYKEIAALL